jgi:membrane fusion protein (multidrug efflux system)
MLRRTALLVTSLCLVAATAASQDQKPQRGAPPADSVAKATPQDSTGAKRGRRGGRGGADAAATPADTGGAPGAPSGGRSGRSGRGAAGGSGGRGQGGGGPRNASVVLGATDVFKVTKGPVEATIAVSGDLRAFENATVRTRIDGVIDRVYVREGQAVSSGALLAKFESSEQEATLRSAEADVAAARSDAETSIWNAQQSKDLFKVGAIAEKDLRLAEQAADASKARLAASEARERTAANGVRDTKITAPFAGSIEKRLVQDGENTPRGTQLFTMVRTTTLELAGSVPARNADDVKPGQVVRFSSDGRLFTGKVSRVSPTIDPASRSVAVYVTVPNPKGLLKGNSFATGQLVTQTISDALVAPVTAVRDNVDGTRHFVYKIQGGELAMVFVQTGIVDDSRGMVQIVDGLHDQDQIVVGSPGTLGPGMKVTIIGNEGGRSGGRRGQKSTP